MLAKKLFLRKDVLSSVRCRTDLQVVEAQRRRARRAEAARLKYHRMSSEERRQYNAMRDAQRRQRFIIVVQG